MEFKGTIPFLLFILLIMSSGLAPFGEFSPQEVFAIRGLLLLSICSYLMHKSPSLIGSLIDGGGDATWKIVLFLTGLFFLGGVLWLEYEGALFFNPDNTPLGEAQWFTALVVSYSVGIWFVAEPFAAFTRFVAQSADPGSIGQKLSGKYFQQIIKEKSRLTGDPDAEIAMDKIKHEFLDLIRHFKDLGERISVNYYDSKSALLKDEQKRFCEMVLDGTKCVLWKRLDPEFNWELEVQDLVGFVNRNLKEEFENLLLERIVSRSHSEALTATMARNLILIIEFDGEVRNPITNRDEHKDNLFESQRSGNKNEGELRLRRQFSLLLFIFRSLFHIRVSKSSIGSIETIPPSDRMSTNDGKMALRSIIRFLLRDDPLGRNKSFFTGEFRFDESYSDSSNHYENVEFTGETEVSEEVEEAVKKLVEYLPRLSRRLDIRDHQVDGGEDYSDDLEKFDDACFDFMVKDGKNGIG